MCGIVGYTGKREAVDILIEGLSNLEYRGYDSAGISVFEDSKIKTVKAKGRLSHLTEKFEECGKPHSTCGIGHTRWATHGEPSDVNSHPHYTEKLSLVHNGIIENYLEIRQFLIEKGYKFKSQTDTETGAKLIDYFYHGDPVDAIRQAIAKIEGSFAFGVIFADIGGKVYATRKDSPLIVGVGEGENFIASDVPAILKFTRNYYLLEPGEIAVISPQSAEVYGIDGEKRAKELLTANWNIEQAQKNGYNHFMLKEIHEQPKALQDTISPRISNGLPSFKADNIPDGFFSRFNKINIVACGTAMHAGMVGKSILQQLARIDVDVEVASEFRYSNPILSRQQLLIVISQSGETADTLAALRLAKSQGITTLAVVNVTGSSIAREADYVIHTYAGPEIAVASTKAYSVQLSVLYLIAIRLALDTGKIDAAKAKKLTSELYNSIAKIEVVLKKDLEIEDFCSRYSKIQDLFFLGRGLDYALSLEGSLKLKEISYIHCEAYAAGELKHGTISLITDNVPVVAVATQSDLLPKMVSNIKEVKTRGAEVLLVCKDSTKIDAEIYDNIITIPDCEDIFAPLLAIIPLQLLAYHTAVIRGCDVDKPRNLAKSVTVE